MTIAISNIPSNLDLLVLIDALGSELQSSNLVGNPCPSVDRRWKRMKQPQPGDLVMEKSTAFMRQRNATNEWAITRDGHIRSECGIGILLRTAIEPFPREDGDEWDEVADGPWPTEKVWYIRRLDDCSEFRWTNADFICILPVEGWETIGGNRINLLKGMMAEV